MKTAVLLLAFLAAGAGPVLGACRTLVPEDALTQAPIAGIEDIAFDRAAGELLLSAFDRDAVARALAEDAPQVPRGGLYALPAAALEASAEPPLLSDLGGGLDDFRPHGIALYRDKDAALLAAINRRYDRDDGTWVRRTTVELFRMDAGGPWRHHRTLESPRFCRANDLVFADAGTLLITRDRGACGRWRATAEDVFGLDRAELVAADLGPELQVRTVLGGLAFANGIAADPAHDLLAVAETRGEGVGFYALSNVLDKVHGATPEPFAVAALEGGADNLSLAPGGEVIAAVHPSLIVLALVRRGLIAERHARSRAVALAPAGGVRTLLDSEDGDAFAGATVAVVAGNHVVLGSAIGKGIAVCPHEEKGS